MAHMAGLLCVALQLTLIDASSRTSLDDETCMLQTDSNLKPRSINKVEGFKAESHIEAFYKGEWHTGMIKELPSEDRAGKGRYAVQFDTDEKGLLTYASDVRAVQEVLVQLPPPKKLEAVSEKAEATSNTKAEVATGSIKVDNHVVGLQAKGSPPGDINVQKLDEANSTANKTTGDSLTQKDDVFWTKKGIDLTKEFAAQLGNPKAGDEVSEVEKAMITQVNKWDILSSVGAFEKKGEMSDASTKQIDASKEEKQIQDVKEQTGDHKEATEEKSSGRYQQAGFLCLLPLLWVFS